MCPKGRQGYSVNVRDDSRVTVALPVLDVGIKITFKVSVMGLGVS